LYAKYWLNNGLHFGPIYSILCCLDIHVSGNLDVLHTLYTPAIFVVSTA